ncbi:putative polyhydroxyalkanoate synthesis repressor PhaR [endosymbiont of Acanthamoeba sp. UWC8]|uniref:polyhydroxyalkanoate synthesis repressor PhaR n=1 Tax=endosymbiont of Acanthamoeba sp. UWC8 TaxID=86106 RepID=UPI0004D14AD3|nr:polyhydroxyalkanoate synthesis repressor PhaR [endosymbiont of Acanthamoeba sp. UWC8]AIF81254.1 putative polyhydroxyalkanoate synthesis repressor PhaR [endosymbiont of Acanthamoeba sp. UWC8]
MPENNKIVIKKYPNRRLYNTAISAYITLEELSNLIKEDHNIIVIDAKTGEDLTRVTLTQIILEHESKGYSLLPLEFLKQIIKLYDNNLSSVFNAYITHSMDHFKKNENNMQEFMSSAGGGNFLFTNNWTKMWEDYSKKNADFMEAMLKNMSGLNPSSNNKKDK